MNYEVSTPVALARDYDASLDGLYGHSPIFSIDAPNGRLEGLGHTISNLTNEGDQDKTGLVRYSSGTLTNLHLTHAYVVSSGGDTVGLGDSRRTSTAAIPICWPTRHNSPAETRAR